MDWTQIISLLMGFIGIGGGLSALITIRLYKRLKKGEVEKLEVDVRKLQEGEFRDRTIQLIKDLSEANETIRRISGELQIIIAREAEKDIELAKLKAENHKLKEELKQKLCSKWCDCLNFENEI
jgi:hypothetical protein